MQRPDQSTIIGAAKLTGRVHGFSLGVMAAAHREESARIAFAPPTQPEPASTQAERHGRGTANLLHRVAGQAGVQRPVVARLHADHHQRATVTDAVTFLPDQRHDRRTDFDWRLGQRWGLTGYWAGQPRDRQPGGDRRAADAAPSTAFSGRTPRHVELDPLGRIARRPFRRHQLQQARRPAHARQRRHRLQVAGVRSQRRRLHARADHIPQNAWVVPGALSGAHQVTCAASTSTSTSGRAQLRRRSAGLGYNFNTPLAVPEPVEHRVRRQLQRRRIRRPPDPRRAWRPLSTGTSTAGSTVTPTMQAPEPGRGTRTSATTAGLALVEAWSRGSCCDRRSAWSRRSSASPTTARSSRRSGSRRRRRRTLERPRTTSSGGWTRPPRA